MNAALEESAWPHRRVRFQPVLLTLIPALDVLALVALFSVLSSVFVAQSGVKVVPPSTPFKIGSLQAPEIITITGHSPPRIYHRYERVQLPQLRQRLEKAADQAQTIVIKADRGADYQTVMSATEMAIGLGYSVVHATTEKPAQ